jgi:hypothetical protein
MYSESQFFALEVMCRERAAVATKEAAVATKEMEYWLAEAEEWKRLRGLPESFVEGRVLPDTGHS